MRSRPKLEVYFQPARPVPGSRLVVEVVAVSRSETPVDGIDLVLRGLERRYSHSAHNGTVTTSHYEDLRPLALAAKIPGPMTLGAGRHVHRAAFDLPPSTTPSIKTRMGLVEYTLDVRVAIPWWPDRRQIYSLEVAAPPTRGLAQRPVTFCSAEGGPRGTDLYLEASLDTTELPAGGVVEGAVSVHNVAHSRVRRVEVAFVGYDRARFRSSAPEVEDSRFVAVVAEGPPPEATPIPFSIKVPEQARPTTQGMLFELAYQVEVRAVVAWGSDVVMRMPCTIWPVGSSAADAPRRGAKRLPPVGSERRAAVWGEVARRAGLDNEAEAERMRGGFGDVALAVTLEHRDEGLWSVATLRWPPLHIGLEVREKKWTDAFREAVELNDAGFAARLWGRGREAAQVVSVLDERTRAALLRFAQVAVDDEGCVVATEGGAHAVEPLQAFVEAAVWLARAFDRSRRAVPLPAAMSEHLARWEAFARHLSGRVDPGEPRIADATFEGEPVEVVTTWSEDGSPSGARVRVLRPQSARDDEGEETARPIDDAAAPLIASLRADEPSLHVGDDAFEVVVPGKPADPAAFEPLLERLVKVARAARGDVQRGPYR